MSDHKKADDKSHAAKAEPKADRSKFQAAGTGEPYTEESPAEKPRPVLIHPAPHVTGVPHPPGEEAEAAEKAENAGADVETPFPDQQAQRVYGLRKEGRLYRCSLEGHPTLLVEADSEKDAREGAAKEWRHRAGESDAKKGKKESPAAMPALPAGFAAVPIEQAKLPPVKDENVRCVKLAP